MAYINDLKTEIDTDPLTRGYAGMTDQQVADDLNTLYRDAAGNIEELRQFVFFEKNRTNTAQDSVAGFIYGRLQSVANSAVGENPFSANASYNLTLKQITSAKAFIEFLNSEPSLLFTDSRFDEMLTDVRTAGVLGAADANAIKALSQNKQSRASELGFPRVKPGHVEMARAA